MKNKVIFVTIFISILIFIILGSVVFFDTGVKYTFHYLKNKIENDFRNNQQNLGKINSQKLELNEYSEFKDVKGWINDDEFIKNKKNIFVDNIKFDDFNNWTRSNGGNFSNKFSSIDQININNISSLKLLWKYDSSKNFLLDKVWKNNSEINPIFFDGVVYVATPYKEILALNALTGKLIWKFKSLKKISSRGMTFWYNEKNPEKSCIFVPIRDSVFCINYKTGKRINSFGKNGFVLTDIVRAAPVIWNNLLMVATLDSLKIKAYSLPEGKLIWEIPLHPKNKNFLGGTPWGGISLDEKNNLLFVSTGNPRPSLYGASRPGRNLNSNSIIAIDLIKRNIKWSFQEVIHDLWDYDIAAPPLLSSIFINGKYIEVVIIMTKIGNTFIFDRISGRPFFDVTYKDAPKSDAPLEEASPKQIYRSFPESTIKFNFTINDFDKRNINDYDKLKLNINEYKFGWFETPSLDKTLLIYGLHGGAQWPGGVFNPQNQNLYIPVNQIPWKIRLYLTSKEKHPEVLESNFKIYKKKCSGCHGAKRNGIYETKKEKEITYIPNLIDIYNTKFENLKIFRDKIYKKHNLEFKEKNIEKIYSLFKSWDKKIIDNKSININVQWSQLLYEDDLPATLPPWGKIVSINLINGKINWQVPNGYVEDVKLGTANFGGILVSKGGLIFATGTDDNKFVVLNEENGKEVWSYVMDSAGSTSPMTFLWKNKQIIIVLASGGRYHNYKDRSGTIYAFAID